MGRPGRPRAITPEVARKIGELRKLPGMTAKGVTESLRRAGYTVGQSTVAAHLRGTPEPAASTDPLSAAELIQIGEDDVATPEGELAWWHNQVAFLRRAIDERQAAVMIGEKGAALEIKRLMDLKRQAELSIQQLTPAPDEEKQRLEELGEQARSELFGRLSRKVPRA